MRAAIVTKFAGPTNTRGSRIIATCQAGRKMVEYDHSLGTLENHGAAAKKLAEKVNWHGLWIGGGLPSQDGYVWVLTPDACEHSQRLHAEDVFRVVGP